MPKNNSLLIVTAALAANTTLYGAYPLLVDDAAIVAPAETEVVLFYEASFGSGERFHAFPVEFTHGLHPRLEMAISSGFGVLDPRDNGDRESGMIDTIAALKALVFEQGGAAVFVYGRGARQPAYRFGGERSW